MSFESPLFLYLLLLLPLVFLLFRRGDGVRKKGLRHFGIPESVFFSGKRFLFRELALTASLACLILALA
ncbi:MAG TPA: hypothetical protein PLA80_12195, partial [Synergistaceae bacterium]|nr:hypothetical protein [Synergistaceae bacterium]